jgi:hypothetical protein
MESLALQQPSKERTRSTTTSRETETEPNVTRREGRRRVEKLTVGSGAVQKGGGEDEGAEEGDPGIHPLSRCPPACLPQQLDLPLVEGKVRQGRQV